MARSYKVTWKSGEQAQLFQRVYAAQMNTQGRLMAGVARQIQGGIFL